MYKLTCKKPAHFLSAQMALVSIFFQMFIVLGMYNFEHLQILLLSNLTWLSVCLLSDKPKICRLLQSNQAMSFLDFHDFQYFS